MLTVSRKRHYLIETLAVVAPSSRSSGTRDEPLPASASAEPKWLPTLSSNVQGRIQKVQKGVTVAPLGPPLNPPKGGNAKYRGILRITDS